jgi:hypothetical protein
MASLCWIAYGVMCVLFTPVLIGFMAVLTTPGVQTGARIASVALFVLFIGLWWAPFGYALYLSIKVAETNDRRLLRRGVRGTAVVLARTSTNETTRNNDHNFYVYRLEVSLPGRATYQTSVKLSGQLHGRGGAVAVYASPRNRKRVTIDPASSASLKAPVAHSGSSSPGIRSRVVMDAAESEAKKAGFRDSDQ